MVTDRLGELKVYNLRDTLAVVKEKALAFRQTEVKVETLRDRRAVVEVEALGEILPEEKSKVLGKTLAERLAEVLTSRLMATNWPSGTKALLDTNKIVVTK